jgi:hypothetical protein
MAKIAINWSTYDLKERAFERGLAEGTATLSDHPLPSGGVLGKATDERVALAAKQFEQRGQDLIALAEWLHGKTPSDARLGGRSAPFFRDLARVLPALSAEPEGTAGFSGRGNQKVATNRHLGLSSPSRFG